MTIERLCDDIREFMDHIGVKAAHFVGASAGGYLTQRIAIDDPGKVLTASLFGATPGLKRSQAKSWLPLIREKGLTIFLTETISDRFPIGECNPALVTYFLEQTACNDSEFLLKFIELMTEQDWSEEMNQITCPTLAVVPAGDSNQSMDEYAVLRDNIPNCKFVVYQGMPHNITDAVPDRCARELPDFLLELGT